LFEKAQEALQERNEDYKGRQWHNGDERLLSGRIKCAKCKSHMFGASTNKKGRKIPYYVCSKRWSSHDCDQDYVRADCLEPSVIQDIKSILLDEQLMARIWEEANKRLSAEKPDLEREIRKIETQMAKTSSAVDRYFKAFEAGKLKPEMCNEKVATRSAGHRQGNAERPGRAL